MMKSSISKVTAAVSASTVSSSSAAAADIITRKVKPLPYIVYGTAWKKERTKSLVVQAITAGFRAIDTGTTVDELINDMI
jgi:ABC-type Zn2+ transport system substrate-binding protein/surface adhesin